MSYLKDQAIEVIDQLHTGSRIGHADYYTIRDALNEIDTLRAQDAALEKMWRQLADVPMGPETERIEERFFGWGPGVHREEILHWFDERHSKGVAYLLYAEAEDYVLETKRLYGLSKLCVNCESKDCQFNHNGQCRFVMVHEVKPNISDECGCLSYEYREEELL